MENLTDLEQKLKIAQEKEKIDNEIKASKCPLCGGSFKYQIRSGGDEGCRPAIGEIKCDNCGIVNYKLVYDSIDSYHWCTDGSSELLMLEKLWSKIKYYIKNKEK